MKLYKYNFWSNYRLEGGEMWALSSYDVEKNILKAFPQAYGIHVWFDYS